MNTKTSDAFSLLFSKYKSLNGIIQESKSTIESIRKKIHLKKIQIKLLSLAKGQKFAIFLNDYDIGDGVSGGGRRITEIVNGTHFDGMKILITFSGHKKYKIKKINPQTISITIPKSQSHRLTEKFFSDGNECSVDDIIAAHFCTTNEILRGLLEAISPKTSHIILEHPYMTNLACIAKQNNADIKIIYNSHNVESTLKQQMLTSSNHSDAKSLIEIVELLEEEAVRISSFINCVTEQDSNQILKYYQPKNPPEILINGTKIIPEKSEKPFPSEGVSELVFIGSAHPPNVIALRKFLSSPNWAAMKSYTLHVIGSSCAQLTEFTDHRVVLHGVVSELAKDQILSQCHLAINPIISGGGSSLKLGEYLAQGIPTISTPEGARGFDLQDNSNILIGDMPDDFFEKIILASKNQTIYKKLSQKSIEFAKNNLSWTIATDSLSRQLKS